MITSEELINQIETAYKNLQKISPKKRIYIPVIRYIERRPSFKEMWFRKPNERHLPVYEMSSLAKTLESDGPIGYRNNGIEYIVLTENQYKTIQELTNFSKQYNFEILINDRIY